MYGGGVGWLGKGGSGEKMKSDGAFIHIYNIFIITKTWNQPKWDKKFHIKTKFNLIHDT